MKAIIKQFFLHGVGNRFFQSVKSRFNKGIPKSKHKLSILKWLILNKQMSLFQKLRRLSVFLILPFLKYCHRGSDYRIVCSIHESCSVEIKSLTRNVELLMKKGYTVLLDLSLTENTISHLDLESRQALVQLITLLKQQKALR